MKNKLKMYLKTILIVFIAFVLVTVLLLPPFVRSFIVSNSLQLTFTSVYSQLWKKPFESFEFCIEKENKDLFSSSVTLIGILLSILAISIMFKQKGSGSYEGIEHRFW